jgi:hypothetical protein
VCNHLRHHASLARFLEGHLTIGELLEEIRATEQ